MSDKSPEKPIVVGMIGGGVVGQGVLRILTNHAQSIRARLGTSLEIRQVAVRDLSRQRDLAGMELRLTARPEDILEDDEVDVVVEVMGGVDRAGALIRSAIERKKSVVTANKALLAEGGHELIELAEAAGVDLYYEAAVAGGVPVIRVLREALASDQVVSLCGIVNGTSNFILTQMSDEGVTFRQSLEHAQASGFAEADPTLDISGGDAAHKLTLLTTLAYGVRVLPEQIETDGIADVSTVDMAFAKRFGYVIKPLAVARLTPTSELQLRVGPSLIDERNVLAGIGGALNAVLIEGASLGPCMLSGYGAGALPTATSVVSDIIDVGRNLRSGARGRVPSRSFRSEHLVPVALERPSESRSKYYLRFTVKDQPGVLSKLSGILGEHNVSIEQMVQEGRANSPDASVSLVMLTHQARTGDMMTALKVVDGLPAVLEPTQSLPIEEV